MSCLKAFHIHFQAIKVKSFLYLNVGASFSRGQMNSWCGIRRILMKSNKCPYPRRTCGSPTSSSMSCKKRERHRLSPVFLTPWREWPSWFLSLTCSVDVGKSPDIPYVYVTHDGQVRNYKPIQVVTACTLNIYNFPFDVQKCSLTFQSWLHTSKSPLTSQHRRF